MIRARLINSDATINNFNEIGSLEFTPGASFNINLQLYNSQLNSRHLPQDNQTVHLLLNPLIAVTVADNPFSIGTTPITANPDITPSGRRLHEEIVQVVTSTGTREVLQVQFTPFLGSAGNYTGGIIRIPTVSDGVQIFGFNTSSEDATQIVLPSAGDSNEVAQLLAEAINASATGLLAAYSGGDTVTVIQDNVGVVEAPSQNDWPVDQPGNPRDLVAFTVTTPGTGEVIETLISSGQEDNSLWTFTVDVDESIEIAGGNITVELREADGTVIAKSIIFNGLSRLVDGDC